MSGTGRTEDGRGRLGNALSGLAVAVGCVLFLGGFAWGAVQYKPYTVPTDSMTPSISAGDRVLAQRITGGEVRRGDVVIFSDSVWGNLPMVKRVVGIGGDKVACCGKDGRLTLNGEPLDEPYLASGEPASATPFTSEVPEGHLFLLGDERRTSVDSRGHIEDAAKGTVPVGKVDARVDAVAWPWGGTLARPDTFAALPGGVSEPGPIAPVLAAVVAGVVLIFGGAAYGPVAKRVGRRRAGTGAR
ncbi:signal peptidase I [Streptomyces chryseus]|uniref:Signal peptidase I n=1 Tax=Streptomyces chryseus TaxID=68186 RepID=A0ABQ3DGP3_9ACTN|nr:signal peptidase I [Streptomyces chryseus]GGW99106.1 signal peptidase I [Streptomyces chryseus]GHA93597.1 signal peptidase I [Streptomyces chryseus]